MFLSAIFYNLNCSFVPHDQIVCLTLSLVEYVLYIVPNESTIQQTLYIAPNERTIQYHSSNIPVSNNTTKVVESLYDWPWYFIIANYP